VCIGGAVGVKPNIRNTAKVPKPNAQLILSASDIIIVTGDSAKCERQMMSHDEHAVANRHRVSESEVIALTNGNRLLVGKHEIARLALKVEADESG
jgi:hypothetical protein